MSFLSSRSPRERGLIYLALALAIILGVWTLAVRPVLSGHSSAEQAQAWALRDHGLVQAGLPYLTQTRADRQPFDRNSLISAARAADIPISRVQPENDGDIKVWFEDSSSEKVFRFLDETTRTYNAAIELVQINRRPDGVISAQITLRPL